MKSFFLIIFSLFYSFNIFSQTQIPNGNFETWTNNEPTPWINSIDALGNTIYTSIQSSDAFQGNSAVKLTSQTSFSQFIPGLITLGEINFSNQTLTGGIPYSDRPDGISFFFKYEPTGTDTMMFGAFLTKLNTENSTIDTIGLTGYLNSDTYSTYTEIQLPFIYQSDEIPDTLNIIFTSSGFNGNTGSSLYLDSISMINGTIVSPTFCFPADEITSSSFKAHWMTIPNALSYNIDISDNKDFTTFLNGYENLNTGTDTFALVNVTPGTYFCRARVNYDSGTSINSNTIEVTAGNTDINNLYSDELKIISRGNRIIAEFPIEGIKTFKLYTVDGKLINQVTTSESMTELMLIFQIFILFKYL